MNLAILTGRLTRDPEVRYSGDKPICHFTVAVDRPGSKDADFIPCTAFGKVADAMEKYSFKGREVEVVGQIRTGSYTGKDGKKVYTTDIWCKQVVFKSWKKETEPRRPEPARPMDDDTIPFY